MDRLNQPKLLSEMDAVLVQSFSRHRAQLENLKFCFILFFFALFKKSSEMSKAPVVRFPTIPSE